MQQNFVELRSVTSVRPCGWNTVSLSRYIIVNLGVRIEVRNVPHACSYFRDSSKDIIISSYAKCGPDRTAHNMESSKCLQGNEVLFIENFP